MKQKEPKDQRSIPDPQHAPPPYPTGEPPDGLSVLYQDHTSPPLPTPESAAQGEFEEQVTKNLLAAYQQTFEVVEDLPAVVWVPWRAKGLRRFVKLPYLRWFIRYFLTHHVYRNLTILNRRLNVIAAMNSDHDVNKWDREALKLYLREGLPPPPYKSLAFAIFFAALLVALPLRSLGDVTVVLDLVGSIMKVDIGGVAKAFTAKELGETVRAMLVLLLTSSILAFFLTSPFVLKRMLFNLYPATRE